MNVDNPRHVLANIGANYPHPLPSDTGMSTLISPETLATVFPS